IVCRNTTGHVYKVSFTAGHSYNWSVSGGTITSGQGTDSVRINWAGNGIGTVSIRETNVLGCDTLVTKI
nr:hypothetical protein [Bacteroidota bacterium]